VWATPRGFTSTSRNRKTWRPHREQPRFDTAPPRQSHGARPTWTTFRTVKLRTSATGISHPSPTNRHRESSDTRMDALNSNREGTSWLFRLCLHECLPTQRMPVHPPAPARSPVKGDPSENYALISKSVRMVVVRPRTVPEICRMSRQLNLSRVSIRITSPSCNDGYCEREAKSSIPSLSTLVR